MQVQIRNKRSLSIQKIRFFYLHVQSTQRSSLHQTEPR